MMESVATDSLDAPVAVRTAGATHPGQRRTENQDNFLISDLSAAENPVTLRPAATPAGADGEARIEVGAHGALLVVADGMGGAAAGRLASGLACTFVLAELQEGWRGEAQPTARRFARRVGEAVEKANGRIWHHAQRHADTTGMGSTITAAGVLQDVVYIAQVGDSRAYLVREGAITQLTRDQSLVQQMVDAGAMTPEDAERSTQGNIILQALGVKPTVEVDVTSQQLRRGDCLILCSDGLHRVVRPDEMVAAVVRLQAPHRICDFLVALANERGGPDNVTVVCALLEGSGLADPQPGDLVSRSPYRWSDTA